ncbi:response regulator [Bremerella cremea]|nr:response regulator [Bremerella cremea]
MRKILVVDDDEGFQFLCKMVFKRSGEPFQILEAYDGVQALEILQSDDPKPDLILLDINMPRMNGHQFLEEYSKQAVGEVPIVAMLTSSEQQRDRQNALSYSFVQDYLLKPLCIEHIQKLKRLYQHVCNQPVVS